MAKLSQTQTGNAFAFAVVSAVRHVIGVDNVELRDGKMMQSARDQFEKFLPQYQENSLSVASAAIKRILEFEAHLEDAVNRQTKLWVGINDSRADDFIKKHNDTRDILIGAIDTDWQIGLVAKHRHEALRNSRLSPTIDFGREWLNMRCSENYFNEVVPIFDRLRQLRAERVEWSALEDKNETVYVPLLSSFRSELLRLDNEFPGMVTPALVHYLIGDYDYYRIVQHGAGAKLAVFNFNGSLNSSALKEPTVHLRKLELPKRIVDLEFARTESGMTSSTTLILMCDSGWQISFRLHNAEKIVQPSLKFDIKLLRTPDSLQVFSVQN